MKSYLSHSFFNILLPILGFIIYSANAILVNNIGRAVSPIKVICDNGTVFDFSLDKCFSDFKQDINEYASEHRDDEYGEPVTYNIPESALCCAVSALRPCITDEVGLTCDPTRTEGIVDGKMKSIYSTFKIITKQLSEGRAEIKCDWDDTVYVHGSVICWPAWGHWTAGSILIILAIMTTYYCFRKGCFHRRKK